MFEIETLHLLISDTTIIFTLLFTLFKYRKLRKDIQKENKSAYLDISIVEIGKRGNNLRIINKGKSEAKNVELFLDNESFKDHPYYVKRCDVPKTISGLGQADILISCTLGSPYPPESWEIHWEDKMGKKSSNSGNNFYFYHVEKN